MIKSNIENLGNEDFEEIYNMLQDYDGSIFNEDINDYMNSNFPNI
mgnify:CR=1 FL=1